MWARQDVLAAGHRCCCRHDGWAYRPAPGCCGVPVPHPVGWVHQDVLAALGFLLSPARQGVRALPPLSASQAVGYRFRCRWLQGDVVEVYRPALAAVWVVWDFLPSLKRQGAPVLRDGGFLDAASEFDPTVARRSGGDQVVHRLQPVEWGPTAAVWASMAQVWRLRRAHWAAAADRPVWMLGACPLPRVWPQAWLTPAWAQALPGAAGCWAWLRGRRRLASPKRRVWREQRV